MNLKLNELQRVALYALKQQPWATPQKISDLLDITPRQAGAVLKQLHMAEAATLRQEAKMVSDGAYKRTKLIREYRLTVKGRKLAARVTPEEVTKFTSTQSRRSAPVAATTSKEEASTEGAEHQYNRRGQRIRTAEEVLALAKARFKSGEWFLAMNVHASYAALEELERRGAVECARPSSTSVRTWRVRRGMKEGF